MGTSPLGRCIPTDQEYDGVDPWPPDFNRDNLVDIFDLSLMTQLYMSESNANPGMWRYDLYPEPMGDGFVDIFDIIQLAGRFAQRCH